MPAGHQLAQLLQVPRVVQLDLCSPSESQSEELFIVVKIKIKVLLRIVDDQLNFHLNMSWSSTSCPCCASRRESRHRSWSLSWSRTSAKIKNQFRCHYCHQLSSSMLESQLKIKIRCHKCHWLSSSKLQLHICQILASLFQLEKG